MLNDLRTELVAKAQRLDTREPMFSRKRTAEQPAAPNKAAHKDTAQEQAFSASSARGQLSASAVSEPLEPGASSAAKPANVPRAEAKKRDCSQPSLHNWMKPRSVVETPEPSSNAPDGCFETLALCSRCMDMCCDWAEQRVSAVCRAEDATELKSLLREIRQKAKQKLELRSKKKRAVEPYLKAAKAEGVAPKSSNIREDPDILVYTYYQHALAQLRKHVEAWPAVEGQTAPAALSRRASRATSQGNASSLLTAQDRWPFDCAGDDRELLFHHRAWLSWRFLALIELPSTVKLWQLPFASSELESVIQGERARLEPPGRLDAPALEEILHEFFHDPWASHAKGRWLRRAMSLPSNCEEAKVLEKLHQCVENALVVLQSLQANNERTPSALSARTAACIALYLYLQTLTPAAGLTCWQPLLMQERSANPNSEVKQYVTSDRLGTQTETALTQFPQMFAPLSPELDPRTDPIAVPPVICWLCGACFLSIQALYRHTRSSHGDWAEYRKHLFWRAQKEGFLPILPWQKRHMLANFSFFQCYSIPESGGIEWSEEHPMHTAVPRSEVGCAICARKDWLEHRLRTYLWREPDSETVHVNPEEEVLQNLCD